MRTTRLALILIAVCATSGAFPQTVDYSLSIVQSGDPVTTGPVTYALVVSADWWTDAQEPFVVRLTLPPGLEPESFCTAESSFDPATRVLTWPDRLDNPSLAQKSCPLVFKAVPPLVPGTSFLLSATLTTSKPDPNPANNAALYAGHIFASSDLAVSSSADVGRFRPGTPVTYTFTVTNLGPHDAHDTKLVDLISPHVTFVSFEQLDGPGAAVDVTPRPPDSAWCYAPDCGGFVEARIPVLPDQATATFRLRVTSKTSFETANIQNRVIVQSTSIDPFGHNNDRRFMTFAGPDADLAVALNRAKAGPRIPVTIEVTNDGPDTVQNVQVQNSLVTAEGDYGFIETVRYLSVTPSQGTCSAPAVEQWPGSPYPPPFWMLDCSLGALAPGAKATITVVIERTPQAGAFHHSSSVSPLQNDARQENNFREITFAAGRRGGKK